MSSCVFPGNKRGGDSTAYKVKKALEDVGLNVFMDDCLEGGDDWGTKLNEALHKATCMVALSSEHFAQLRKEGEPMAGTSWTRNEVSAFLKQRPKNLIPLLHSGSWPPTSLTIECSNIEEVKLAQGFDVAMDKVKNVIAKRRPAHINGAEAESDWSRARAASIDALSLSPRHGCGAHGWNKRVR